MLITAILLALLSVGSAQAEILTEKPAGATIVAPGTPFQIQGRLSQTDGPGRVTYATDLTPKLYHHQIQNFAYSRVEHLQLKSENGQDLYHLAGLVGGQVTLSGTFQRFKDPNGSSWDRDGMIVTAVHLRGQQLPLSLPTEERLAKSAQAAVKAYIHQTRPECTIEGPLTVKPQGDLLFHVSTWLRPDWSGPEFPRVYEFDALTGAVKLIQ